MSQVCEVSIKKNQRILNKMMDCLNKFICLKNEKITEMTNSSGSLKLSENQ